MVKVNCREDNHCVFCKFWLGRPAKVNHITGASEITNDKGLCSQRNKYCEATEICRNFKKSLLYM